MKDAPAPKVSLAKLFGVFPYIGATSPATLSAEVLKHNAPLPLEWTKQREILLCG